MFQGNEGINWGPCLTGDDLQTEFSTQAPALSPKGLGYLRHAPAKTPRAIGISAITYGLLAAFAASFTLRPSLNKLLKGADGWINFSMGICSRDFAVSYTLVFKNGRVSVLRGIKGRPDTTLVFRTPGHILKMLSATPDEVIAMLAQSSMNTRGNLAYASLFNFYLSLLLQSNQQKTVKKRIEEKRGKLHENAKTFDQALKNERAARRRQRISCRKIDKGVKYLEDPFLPQWGLEDFPRLAAWRKKLHDTRPKICHERPKLLTDWHRAHGFESDNSGRPWIAELRQAYAFRHLMENRRPIIWDEDIFAGTSGTSFITPLVYPDAAGHTIWGELFSCRTRELVPYEVDDQTIRVLHHEIYPYWAERNIREWVRRAYGEPLSLCIDEHLAAYFVWKSIGMSETIPDWETLLNQGTRGIIENIEKELAADPAADTQKKNTLHAMIISLEAVNAYARNLAAHATSLADETKSPSRKKELLKMARALGRVPARPPRNLFEAVQAIWILKIALNMENSNDGTGYGRLDQLCQPFFEADMKKAKTQKARREYVKQAVELMGCLFLKTADHVTLNPDIANILFGGSPPNQTITLGGVTPAGEDAVNDMTYILLKVTELLGLTDPNVNARYHKEKNSGEYLRRCVDVNYITGATPALHNDTAMIEALSQNSYDIADIRDWSATGCVEPTMSGRHCGATSAINLNIVAALEMALNNGHHPLMGWDLGPETGSIEQGGFKSFDDFFGAFEAQYRFLIENSVQYNNACGKIYQLYRPSNLMSVFTRGCIKNGRTVVNGGAKINSTGATCIGLADVTDSMMAIKKLVFDDKAVSLKQLKKAIDENFDGHEVLRSRIVSKVPFFGSGDNQAVQMADRIARLTHKAFSAHKNYRGGTHHTGFWSMSSHAAYGRLSGALPSGRLAGKPFTPGLTPEPNASKNLLDNLKDVAMLDPANLDNNIAFNVKVAPGPRENHEQVVDSILPYVKTFFTLGGMQMQMNVVSTDMMRDAMAHPENYRTLLVRISGYCAYFTQLDEQAQLELIERAEYGL
ncbi:MAG: pyruvate formate lyase family protein [Desulfatibacillaceae bacterium]|nr:pyruvate formate lyase family protein [Desulfatibacillaceae bacterium]